MRREILFATLVAVAVTLLGAPHLSNAQESAAPAAGAVRLEPVPAERVAREADRATDIARRTSGVQKVVRLFEIITEEELLEMQAPANTAPGTTGSGRPM